MHLEARILSLRYVLGGQNQVELRDALGGRDRTSMENHLEAEIKSNSVMHLLAMIERVWRCTCRSLIVKLRDVF
jgi:hypothetical protein